ncbi:MAG: phosphate signaling complex protein PhoU [Eubacteriales bacterium]
MRSGFDSQLETLNEELVAMGALCENAIALSARALSDGDADLAKRVTGLAEKIDTKEREIEGMCLKLLLSQQPVARDLRTISSALKMVTDMERIGDQSADIAEIVATANISAGEDALNIRDMASAAIKMVTESVEAFVKKDVGIAKQVIEYDDVVDNCFCAVKDRLTYRLKQPGADGEYALDLLMIAKYFERIGDHAVNIAGWVIFSITGIREAEMK